MEAKSWDHPRIPSVRMNDELETLKKPTDGLKVSEESWRRITNQILSQHCIGCGFNRKNKHRYITINLSPSKL